MSATLCWKPVQTEQEVLPDALRFILMEKWPAIGRQGFHISADDTAILCYLDGLVDAKVDGATALLAALDEHHEIVLSLQH